MLDPNAAIARKHVRPLKRIEFEQLAELGCFDDERVELLFGLVVKMTPPKPQHEQSVISISDRLRNAVRDRAGIRTNVAFAASDVSEPVPDIAIVAAGEFWDENPTRAFLIVEVSRTSLRKDRGPKKALYGLAQVDEYWIVNHFDRCIEVFRDPEAGAWKTHAIHAIGEIVRPLCFPDIEIRVGDVLPPEGDVVPPDDDDTE